MHGSHPWPLSESPSTFVFFSNFDPQPENIYVKAHQRVSIARLPATKPFPGPLHGTDTFPLIGSDIHTYLQIKHKLTVRKGKVYRNLRCDEPKRQHEMLFQMSSVKNQSVRVVMRGWVGGQVETLCKGVSLYK